MAAVTDIRDALLGVLDHVYHFRAPSERTDHYAVWGETYVGAAMCADDTAEELRVSGALYYYTADEYDATVDAICDALTRAGAAWRIANVGYDATLRQIVYDFAWEVSCGAGEIYCG